MIRKPKRNFSPYFRLEATQLVVDQNYTVRGAAEAMNVGHSTMDKWVRQLHRERGGESPKAPNDARTAQNTRVGDGKRHTKNATVDSSHHRNTLINHL